MRISHVNESVKNNQKFIGNRYEEQRKKLMFWRVVTILVSGALLFQSINVVYSGCVV